MHHVSVIVDYIDPSTNRLKLCSRFIVKQHVYLLLDVRPMAGQGIPVWATDDYLVVDHQPYPYTHWFHQVTQQCDLFQMPVMYAAHLFTWLAEREDFECTPNGSFYPLQQQWNEQLFTPEDFGNGRG